MKKNISLVLFALFNTISSHAATSQNIEGQWTYSSPSETLELRIIQSGNKVKGNYCAVTQNGNKIDCYENSNEFNLEGELNGNKFKIIARGLYDPDAEASLDIETIETNKITWKVEHKAGNIFIPANVVLTRENNVIIVSKDRDYIHKTPAPSARTNSYFIRGDAVKVLKMNSDGWLYVKYKRDQKSGWLAPRE